MNSKKIGFSLIIAPFVGIAVAIIGFSLSAVTSSWFGNNIITNLINWVSWFIGLLFVVLGPIFLIMGIIHLRKSKREIIEGASYDERSGKKQDSIMPDEIKGWNWGAAGLTWIWGAYHGVWISLLSFIPLVNIIMWIVLGLKGNEWAWRAEKWRSVEEFIISQKKWKPWGIAIFILTIASMIVGFLK